MSWMRKLFGKTGKKEPSATDQGTSSAAGGQASAPAPTWLAAEDPGNPFGVRMLNLMGNLQWIASTEDRAVAERALSWRPGHQHRLARPSELREVRCDLSFPAADELPDGMLFVPGRMEDKWVIAWVDGDIRIARSWTGATVVVAPATHRAGALHVQRILLEPDSQLAMLGDPVRVFDWLVRVHALGQRIALEVSDEGARLLESSPLVGFSQFGTRLFAAATAYSYPAPDTVLCSDGAVVAAIQARDPSALETLLEAGATVTAPCTLGGYRPMHLALVVKSREILELLLRHGADANQRAPRGTTPLHAGISVGADETLLSVLVAHGADIELGDAKGFRPLHEAAQADSAPLIRWLIAQGADLEARTSAGFTPLHIACALGRLSAAKALRDAGADTRAASPQGTPLAIAEAEGKVAVRDWLRSLGV